MGSPRDLLLNNDIRNLASRLKEMSRCTLEYKLFGHRKLLRAQRLLAENEAIGRFDVIAGLVPKEVSPSGSTGTKFLSVVGDEEIIEGKNDVFCVPAKPNVAIPLSLKVSDCDVFIPDRAAFENRLIASVAKNLASSMDAQILSRSLKIGLHNGHTVLGGEWQSYAIIEDRNDKDVLVIESPVVEVHGFAPHELMGLVFLVEYEVGIPAPSQSRFDTQAMIKSLSTVRNGQMVTNVIIGTSMFLPYDGKLMHLQNSDSLDWSGVELKLRTDEICSIFSPKPVFIDSAFTDENRADSKRAVKDFDDKDDVSNDDSARFMNINFKLSAFDTIKGEIEHMDEVDANQDDTKEVASRNTKFLDDDVDDESTMRRSTERKHSSARPERPERPSKIFSSSRRETRRDDDDDVSVADSLVGGDSVASSLRIDPRYYASVRERVVDDIAPTEDSPFLVVPKNKNSLLARSMQAPLAMRSSKSGKRDLLEDADFGVDTTRAVVGGRELRSSREVRASFGDMGGFRDISRGAKARLGRYGFDGVVTDSIPSQAPKGLCKVLTSAKRPNVDIELEIRDSLSLHDVNIQFAGYRAGNCDTHQESSVQVPRPKSLYFSYQFYTCQPTRTEVMRLLPADKGQLCVLVRDESQTRDEPPLSLRYVVDCSTCSPTEPAEFAEYLASKSLLIDVWDADSLILIGTCCVPLRRIMRQGEISAKCALECDVVNAEVDAQTHGGITSSVICSGAMSGQVVGSVHIILSNFGQPGRRVSRAQNKMAEVRRQGDIGDALSWRVQGLNGGKDSASIKRGIGRPKNSVRAKPLSESAPELSEVLNEYRHSSEGSMRSMTTLRGGEGVHTLNYDEVVMLFKRFKGTVNGTVQYVGKLMQLLDIPSYAVALRKLTKAYQAYGDDSRVEQEMLKFADAREFLNAANIGEFIRSLFEAKGIKYRIEEVALLSEKLGALSPSGAVKPKEIVAFCRNEADSQEWVLVGKRFKRAVSDAYLVKTDVEQLLSEADKNGDNYISAVEFKNVLQTLSKNGKMSARDVALTVKHFSLSDRKDRDSISLSEVMAYIGKKYVGNLEVRLADALSREYTLDRVKEILSSKDSKRKGYLLYDELQGALSELGAYKDLSHEQVLCIIQKVDVNHSGQVAIESFMRQIFGSHSSTKKDDTTADSLLRVLRDAIKSQAVDVGAVFRNFDKDGNGSISRSELEEGLGSLGIFDAVSNWRSQIPAFISKFDTSGDGSVSLKEFYKFVGIVDYAPNIIQRMTKVFAAVSEKGLSIKEVFDEFDANKDGSLGAAELVAGLKSMGTFDEVTEVDAHSLIKEFDRDGDKHITCDEFCAYFSSRVEEVSKIKQKKRSDKLLFRFRGKMKAVCSKGATLAEIFNAFDKDKGGTISKDELAKGLSRMSDFKDINEMDLKVLLESMHSKTGEIGLKDFELFIDPESLTVAPTSSSAPLVVSSETKREQLAVKVREVFRKASAKDLSVDALFKRIDKNGDGNLSAAEFRVALSKMKEFGDISSEDINFLVSVLDQNGDGFVSLSEFKAFLENNGPLKAEEKDLSERENFIRSLRRIGEPDGGVDALLAHMDDDEDGLIQYAALMRMLKREAVFSSKVLTEEAVDNMLRPMTKNGNISVPALLRFVDGNDSLVHYVEKTDDDDIIAVADYDFSTDVEVNALEKKMRGLGRILAKKGCNVEELFRCCDSADSGMIRRTDFIEVLSKMGLYILEQGRVLNEAGSNEADPMRRQQVQQIHRLKGNNGSYSQNAPRAARRLVMSGADAKEGDFKEHLESMALVNWYRQSQKKLLMQRVLSHSLASSIRIYPRFGKTLFFEFPVTNPFSHEERFIIDTNDPELRLVTSFDEWLHLRQSCRSANGELGPEPVEAEMFDRDGYGNVQVVLLPHETLHIPFTFMTLVPYSHAPKKLPKRARFGGAVAESKSSFRDGGNEGKSEEKKIDQAEVADDDEEPSRSAEVRIISGSHGHVVSVLKVLVCPRPFVVHRTIRFFEPENSIMKRRIQLVDYSIGGNMFPSESSSSASKYVHCVESDDHNGQSNVVIEWGPSDSGTSLDMLLRYRCGSFPDTGSFYLIIYNDHYQSWQHEVSGTPHL